MSETIGKLNRRIVIQARTDVADTMGGASSSSWATHATVWAKIETRSAREHEFAGKLRHVATHKVTIRKLSTVIATMRFTYGGRTFQIHGVRPADEDSRWTVLDCEEGVAS